MDRLETEIGLLIVDSAACLHRGLRPGRLETVYEVPSPPSYVSEDGRLRVRLFPFRCKGAIPASA
jgi:hypothetical protein